MKYLFIILFSIAGQTATAQGRVSMNIDEPQGCSELQNQNMTFLVDGSLQNAAVVKREVARLKPCGLDDYDVRFFGRMESLSSLLKKLTQVTIIDQITYGDLLIAINDMKQTANYIDLKNIALLSQKLAETKGNIRTWESDVQLFKDLGASQQVIDKVYRYLREHPENEMTYQELLMKMKK